MGVTIRRKPGFRTPRVLDILRRTRSPSSAVVSHYGEVILRVCFDDQIVSLVH
jgi:hypothetical protein